MSYTKNKLSNIHGKLFEVIHGVEGDCLVLGDEDGGDRIAGPKPWGGGQVVKQFRVNEEYGPIEYLESENKNLRELVADMWRFTGTACKKYPRLFDPAVQGGQMVQLNMLDAFEQRLRELGIEVDK